MAIKFEFKDGMLGAVTPFHKGFINRVKQIEGRKWDAARRMWWVPIEAEAFYKKEVAFFFNDEDEADEAVVAETPRATVESHEKAYTPSAIMNYADIVVGDAGRLLSSIKQNGGYLSPKLVESHLNTNRGHYSGDSLLAAQVACGGYMDLENCKANAIQMQTLVAKVKAQYGGLIQDIHRLREEMK